MCIYTYSMALLGNREQVLSVTLRHELALIVVHPCGPPWALVGLLGACGFAWALIGQALMRHPGIYIYIYICICI